ncbi:MAG: hypothetical protein HQK75_17045 [Candidatus Magnetomorum sp.]|nr:hypothetical protein [Candidatus Magnetomorum sp.]
MNTFENHSNDNSASDEFEPDKDDIFIFKAWDVFTNNEADTKDYLAKYDPKKEVILFFAISIVFNIFL